ncbi:hypothetical protein HYE68_003330 [Fusarium pseudograminearum]|nr:hypothetical protein HYE68_003330 [Fusarium pseudograminearum]
MAANRDIIVIGDDEELNPQQPRPRNESTHLTMDGIQGAFDFVRGRPSGAIINNENDLSLRELQALSTFLQSLSETMNAPATIADFRRFLLNIFDGWNSVSQVPPHPLVPKRKFMDTHIKVGQPVYFGLSINYETNVVHWDWRDSKNAGISPDYVALDPEHNDVTIRTQAMLRYDSAERNRIRTYNCSVLTNCAQKTITKWARAGTAQDPVISDVDRPLGLLELLLSGPIGRADARRMIQATDQYELQT